MSVDAACDVYDLELSSFTWETRGSFLFEGSVSGYYTAFYYQISNSFGSICSNTTFPFFMELHGKFHASCYPEYQVNLVDSEEFNYYCNLTLPYDVFGFSGVPI